MADPDLFLFVSHVAEDRAAAMEIVEELERRGVPCWIAPRNVRPGHPFDDEIVAAIEGSRAMLLVFSDLCNESEYIRREVTVAGGSHKIIIPFRIEDAQPRRGLRVRLSDLHWIDGFATREHAVDELARHLGDPASAALSSSTQKARPGPPPDNRPPEPGLGARLAGVTTAPAVARKPTRLLLGLIVVVLVLTGGGLAIFRLPYPRPPKPSPVTTAIPAPEPKPGAPSTGPAAATPPAPNATPPSPQTPSSAEPPPRDQEASDSAGHSIWMHNGSTVYLVANGSAREFYYQQPRSGMMAAGARPGSLLFWGKFADGSYSGTAYIFNARCGKFPYAVSGPVLDGYRRVVMQGDAPRIGTDCKVVDHVPDTLEFSLINGPS